MRILFFSLSLIHLASLAAPIHDAVSSENQYLVTSLIDEDPKNLELPDANGDTPLAGAVRQQKSLGMIDLLIIRGANLLVVPLGYTSLLAMSVAHNDLRYVARLLRTQTDWADKDSLLEWANKAEDRWAKRLDWPLQTAENQALIRRFIGVARQREKQADYKRAVQTLVEQRGAFDSRTAILEASKGFELRLVGGRFDQELLQVIDWTIEREIAKRLRNHFANAPADTFKEMLKAASLSANPEETIAFVISAFFRAKEQ